MSKKDDPRPESYLEEIGALWPARSASERECWTGKMGRLPIVMVRGDSRSQSKDVPEFKICVRIPGKRPERKP